MNADVVIGVQTRLLAHPGPQWLSVLSWSASSPLSVTLTMPAEGTGPVVWTFARDLLTDGLVDLAGCGDVRVFPAGSSRWIILHLSSDDGTVHLEMSRAQVLAFLHDSHRLVPRGEETVDVDTGLADLFEGES